MLALLRETTDWMCSHSHAKTETMHFSSYLNFQTLKKIHKLSDSKSARLLNNLSKNQSKGFNKKPLRIIPTRKTL
jgi:hypothetical protein